jgi:hypothetical protein
MKSIARFSALVGVAALLSFAPCAFGQGKAGVKATNSGSSVLRYAPSSFLAVVLGPPGGDRGVVGNAAGNGGGGNGCGSQGWSGGGRDDRGWGGGGNGGGGCTAVPEGGPAFMYILLASLCCLGALVSRFQRRVGVRETT